MLQFVDNALNRGIIQDRNLDQGADGFTVFKGVHKLGDRTDFSVGELLEVLHVLAVVQRLHLVGVFQLIHLRKSIILLPEEPVVQGPRFHNQRKGRQLRSALVNVETDQIVFQNQCRNITFVVALLLVHLVQQVHDIDEYMARTRAGFDDTDFLWVNISIFDLVELSLYFRRLLRIIYIVIHRAAERGLWIAFHPDAAYGVLCHVAHDPIRSKELRHCRKRILGDRFLCSVHSIFLRGDIKLVHPANDLHVVHEIFFWNLHQPRQYGLPDQERLRKQELHVSHIM